MKAKNKTALKKEIFRLVEEYYTLEHAGKKFVPGESSVAYGGRVFDAREMVSLVDSALEFWLTEGRFTREFEGSLSAYLGSGRAFLVNSGSSANFLALSALASRELGVRRLKKHDEVITTACGFPTTVNPIVQNGLKPVFVDVTLPTYNVDVELLEKALTRKTKAIFLAHTLGNPFNLAAVEKIARKHGLFLLEDACDALGSGYDGKKVGTFGDIATFSFYPAHQITTGEGGAVVAKDARLQKIILSLRDWGRACWCSTGHDNSCKKRFSWKLGKLPFGYDHKYVYSNIGYNLKATDLQAAIGVEQLKKLPGFIYARRKNFGRLYQELKKYEEYFILPQATINSEPAWFGFLLTVRPKAPFSRNDIVRFLESKRIATRMLFAGNITRQPAYQKVDFRVAGTLKNTDLIMNNTFWIGVYPGLTEDKIEYILKTFDSFFGG